MKVETSAELLRIDVLTESHGNSACNLFVADPNTEVYYGGLHARVTFIDLGIEITMNSEPGDWTDAKWVRAHAWKEVCKRVTPSAFAEALAGARSQGRREGAEQAKYDMRKALGVED